MTTHSHDHAPIETAEGPSYFEILEISVRELLTEKGLISADEHRRHIEVLDSRNPTLGSKVIARAWIDSDYRERLLEDGSTACEELGITMYDDTKLIVHENTNEVHNVIVCTLCSCYPRPVLGLPPDWYKSKSYRARIVKEPRQVLSEFGLKIADEKTIRVHDSNANMRYLILPQRPLGTEGWSEDQLASIVTRDTMIGVAEPNPSVSHSL